MGISGVLLLAKVGHAGGTGLLHHLVNDQMLPSIMGRSS
jgi:hypothetical protein